MNTNQITIGKKIGLGFLLLILIISVLGSLGIWWMKTTQKESEILVQEYVPEMAIASGIRGGANRLMYHMRGFVFTENPDFFASSLKELDQLDTGIQKGNQLLKTASHLKQLKTELTGIEQAKNQYKNAMVSIKETILNLAEERKVLDQNALTYTRNSNTFLENQNQAFQKDLQERQTKVALVTDMVNLGNKVHVLNFKAQIFNDMKKMRASMELLSGLDQFTDKLKPITRNPGDIKRIEETEKAAKSYIQAMEGYILTNKKLTTAERHMKANARAYIANGNVILKSQTQMINQGKNITTYMKQIQLVTQIMTLGNTAQVMNYKAMANQDIKQMQSAVNKFKKFEQTMFKLEQITSHPKALQRISEARIAGENYIKAMDVYLNAFQKLDDHRAVMEKVAGLYGAQCHEFLYSQQKNLATDMHERHGKIALMNQIMTLGKDTRIQAFKSQALNDPEIMSQGLARFKTIDTPFEKILGITRETDDIKRLEAIKKAGIAYQNSMAQFLKNWETLKQLDHTRETLGQNVIKKTKSLQDTAGQNTDRIANNAASKLGRASFMMFVGLGSALVIGLLLSVLISRSIMGLMRNVAGNMDQGATQVAFASEHIANSSQAMADGSARQAASIEEASSAIEQMAAMTRQNAENSGEADQLMKTANETVNQANKAMIELTRSMSQISQASKDTGNIISTIDQIAFQTNLLALNAAVEAARAGEAGAGFAVVADEVRNLAIRAADAAKDTAGLIEGTLNQVELGNTMVEKTNEAFTQVAQSTGKVGQLVREISNASVEQSTGIDQINQTIGEMSGVVQQVAANAEEMASASEELNAQAEQMKFGVNDLMQMVGVAKTDQADPELLKIGLDQDELSDQYEVLGLPDYTPGIGSREIPTDRLMGPDKRLKT